jgi:hypothetical protein
LYYLTDEQFEQINQRWLPEDSGGRRQKKAIRPLRRVATR